MISLSGAVHIVVLFLVAGMIFGLLAFLVNYCERKFPGTAGSLFYNGARILLVIVAVLFLIGVLLSLVNEKPLFRA